MEVHYDFTMDLEGKRAVFDALRIRAVQQDKEFLKGQINQPMTLVWGGDSIEAPDSRFELAVANTTWLTGNRGWGVMPSRVRLRRVQRFVLKIMGVRFVLTVRVLFLAFNFR